MEEQTTKTSNSLGVPVAIVVAGVIIAAALFFRTGGNAPTNQQAVASRAPAVAGEQIINVDVKINDNDPFLGKADAPVTMVEFSDFQCPFCKQYHDTTFQKIKQTYIDTGKVKYVFKDFPLSQIHPRAQASSEAAQCAYDQGKFWEYGDILFKNQGALTDDNLKQYAVDLKLDTTTFNECFSSGKHRADVSSDQQDGIAAQVTGTPGFAINGRRLDGAQPWEKFQSIIEEALAKK